MRERPAFARAQRLVADVMLALSVLFSFSILFMMLATLGDPFPVTWGTDVGGFVWGFLILAFPVMGRIIVGRVRSNLIGWMLLWVGFTATFGFAASLYGTIAVAPRSRLPFATEIASTGNWTFIPWIAIIGVFIPQTFPQGRALSHRWRLVLWALLVLTVAGVVGAALAPGPLEVDPRISNPFGVRSPVVDLLGLGIVALPGGTILSVVAVVLRYRRGSEVERTQLRWFLTAITLVAMIFLTVFLVWVTSDSDYRRPAYLGVMQDVANGAWSLIALAIGVAVLRYRLYAIDVVINRALVYGSLTATLGAIYLVGTVAFQAALRPFTGEGDIAVAASTLVVAALFGPLRRRLQTFIDRRFYRARYDARLLAERFAVQMRQRTDLSGIAAELEATVRTAVHPASASVWLRPR